MINQIITARVMTMNVAKYHRFVSTIEATEWFRDQVQKGDLKITYYPHTKSLCRRGSVGAITENGFLFSCEHFAVTYNLSPTVAIDKNWHTLRHINQRNSITHRIIEIIILLQQEYLVSQDPITLRQLPYQQIITEYKRLYPDSYMDASVISRLVKTILLEVKGKTTLLNELLPGKSYLSGLRIEMLLKTTDPLLTDEDLQRNLANKFDLHVTRRYVSYCRNLMGIPDVRLRRKKDFHFFSLGFNRPVPLQYKTLDSIPEVPGVYQFCLVEEAQEYVNSTSSIVYIGSSGNLNNRIKTYLYGYGHTTSIREYIKDHSMTIRFQKIHAYRATEARIIHAFVEEFGELPFLNKVKPGIEIG